MKNKKIVQQTTCFGMKFKLFTVVAFALLAGLTMAYPYALHRLFYPVIYPYVRDFPFVQELAGIVMAMVWFYPLFGFEYWVLLKRRRMKEAMEELAQQSTPQP